MANIDKKQKRWYSKSTFDSLDKTTIPIGTEIQVGGELGQADFDSDTNTKLNNVANKLDKTGGTITGSLTISQNLIVNGTTSTVESTSLKVADKLIYVAKDNAVALTTPAGLITPKYDGTNNGGIVYDNTGTAYVGDIALDSNGNVDVNNSDLQPIATRDDDSNLTNGNLISWDATNNKLVDSGKNSDSFATKSVATTSANGLMSSADKTKLDGIATGANNYTHPTYTPHPYGFYEIAVDETGHVTAASPVDSSDIKSVLGYTPAGLNDLTELKVELNHKFVKDPNKTYLVFIGNEFPGNETAQFKASEGSTIDWGDGNVETFDTAPEGRGITTHTYADSTADDYHLLTISGGSGIPANAFKQVRIYKAIIGSYDCGDIGNSAFDGCGELEEVEFSTSSVNIGNSAFQGCSSLMEIFLHDVSSIGDYAFGGCSLLKKCVIDNVTPPTIGTDSFDSTYSDFRIFVPRIAYDTYISDSGWSDYTNITVFAPDNLDLEYKQDALSTEQMNAVNSSITAAKVSTYDGYSTSKQDKLTTAQLNAVNSGITSSKVSTYDGYATSISKKLTTPTTPTADSAIVIGANGNVSTKLLTEFSSNVTAYTSSPSEGVEVMRGINIDGTDYAFPNRYEHWISGGFTTSDSEFSVNFSFKSDDYLSISDLSEVPHGNYTAYVRDNTNNFSGLAWFYIDGSGNYLISGAISQNGSMDAYTFSESAIDFHADTVIEL